MNDLPFKWLSPVGWIALVGGPAGLREIILQPEIVLLHRRLTGVADGSFREILQEARRQIEEYFAGSRLRFQLPVDITGVSPFANTVLRALQEIPYGETVTYGELAALVGHPGAARAVGRVMAHNRLPIVIPCHRVVGAGGKLTGYSAGDGIASKEWLLGFERQR